jgi:acetyl-CoA carboxylase biotin carboxyl carrier protein
LPVKKPQIKPSVAKAPSSSRVDLTLIEALARIVGERDLTEIEIEHDGLRVRVARALAAAAAPAAIQAIVPAAAATAPAAPVASEAPAREHPGAVKSPMVGTAYLRATPESKPFVEVGSTVKVGDKLLLVEAMKTFNEILATKAGRVHEILVGDGSPVEYGQTLLVIE